MQKNKTTQRLLALVVAAGFLGMPVFAQSSEGSASGILKKVAERNPNLKSFQTRMHVQVHMLNFPFLAPHLDGTAYYKRPGKYEVVFDRVPAYAKGIDKLYGNIGDVSALQRDWNISYLGVRSVDGHPYFTLSMTKKIRSDQIKQAIAYVDPSSYQVARMEWQYFNGGDIVMTQSFRSENGYNVVASQHADIHIPHVRAVADSGFDKYQTNVSVPDSVFANKN